MTQVREEIYIHVCRINQGKMTALPLRANLYLYTCTKKDPVRLQ